MKMKAKENLFFWFIQSELPIGMEFGRRSGETHLPMFIRRNVVAHSLA
jgi:hypothetical protein